MIKAEQKPMEEILSFLEPYNKILLSGCGACVAVCHAGGEKEVEILASGLRMVREKQGRRLEIVEYTPTRQCEPEFADELAQWMDGVEVIVSIACGVGVQTIARRYPKIPVYPGVNTCFMGETREQGVWVEGCQACGECVLDRTGGICPVSRCAKQLFNGPCGGSSGGKCEINKEVDCAWQLIYDRMKELGQLHKLEEFFPAKKWSSSRDGGPRKIEREDLRL